MYSAASTAGCFVSRKYAHRNFRAKKTKKPIYIEHSSNSIANQININVSGSLFRIQDTYLKQHPGTLLGSKDRRSYYDEKENEYFFDRDPYMFRFIHKYYKTNKLHFVDTDCFEEFLDELQFFRIRPEEISGCCSEAYAIYLLKKENLERVNERRMPPNNFRQKCWEIFDNPSYSLTARIIYYVSCFTILISVIFSSAETVYCSSTTSANVTTFRRCGEEHFDLFFTVESICVAFFTVEYFLRLYGAPERWKYMKNIMSVLDILAILPYFIDVTLRALKVATDTSAMNVLVVFKILRITRIFKLVRHSKRLKDLSKAISSSTSELGFIVFMYFIIVVIFASIIYYAENINNDDTKFVSIPESIWYTVVTTTTLGYGDIVPQTIQGKLIGSLCCLMGVLVIALPVPIIQMKTEKLELKDIS